MTAKALLSGNLPEGHGLQGNLVDAHFIAREKRQKIGAFPALVMIKPIEHTGRDAARGGEIQNVRYQILALEVENDPELTAAMRYRMQNLADMRGGTDPILPLNIPGQAHAEQAAAAIERIEAWAQEHELTGAQLEERWRDYWAIGAGQDYSFGDRGVPADYRKSPAAWLLEFAYEVGALTREEPAQAGDPTDPDHDGDDAEGDDD